jgi:hypothetical protein
MNTAGPGAPALTGGAVPAQSMLGGSGSGGNSAKTGPTLANQGTGLGDLLTHGEGNGFGNTGLGGDTHVSLMTTQSYGRPNTTPRRSIWRRIHHISLTSDWTASKPCWAPCSPLADGSDRTGTRSILTRRTEILWPLHCQPTPLKRMTKPSCCPLASRATLANRQYTTVCPMKQLRLLHSPLR